MYTYILVPFGRPVYVMSKSYILWPSHLFHVTPHGVVYISKHIVFNVCFLFNRSLLFIICTSLFQSSYDIVRKLLQIIVLLWYFVCTYVVAIIHYRYAYIYNGSNIHLPILYYCKASIIATQY